MTTIQKYVEENNINQQLLISFQKAGLKHYSLKKHSIVQQFWEALKEKGNEYSEDEKKIYQNLEEIILTAVAKIEANKNEVSKENFSQKQANILKKALKNFKREVKELYSNKGISEKKAEIALQNLKQRIIDISNIDKNNQNQISKIGEDGKSILRSIYGTLSDIKGNSLEYQVLEILRQKFQFLNEHNSRVSGSDTINGKSIKADILLENITKDMIKGWVENRKISSNDGGAEDAVENFKIGFSVKASKKNIIWQKTSSDVVYGWNKNNSIEKPKRLTEDNYKINYLVENYIISKNLPKVIGNENFFIADRDKILSTYDYFINYFNKGKILLRPFSTKESYAIQLRTPQNVNIKKK